MMKKLSQFLSAALTCAALASCIGSQDCQAATEARASKWGFNAEDSTDALVAALNSKVDRLIVDKMPTPWITNKPLRVPSNIEIVFEEGAELQAKRGCFKGKSDSLVNLYQVENVTIKGLGKGATFRMHKKDYHTAAYEKAEWRHTLNLIACKNVNISNLILLESGGDGIYFGVDGRQFPPTNVTIRNVICDGHNRQGLSIIAGVNCLVENCQFINTWGTAPAAGVDFEPNCPGERIDNFVLRNCVARNNQGCGYTFYMPNSTTKSGRLGITLENCIASNDQQSEFAFITLNGEGYERPGQVLVKNCTFENNKNGISFNGSSAKGFKTVFENVTLRNIANGSTGAPIYFGYGTRSTGTCGNIVFKNVNVYDTVDREPFKFVNGGLEGGLENISGKITSYLNGKKNREMVFTDEWAKKTYPKRVIKVLPPVDITNMKFAPATPDAKVSGKPFSPIKLRGTGIWNIQANAGDTLNFTAAYDQLAYYPGTVAPVTLVTPSGKQMPLGDIPFKKSKAFEVKAMPETGLYTLKINAGASQSRIVTCNRPIVLRAYPEAIHLCGGQGDLFFYVPEGTEAFAAQFIGEGMEGLKATVFGPDGNQLWFQDDISRLEQFDCGGDLAQKGGVFRVHIEKPTHLATIEDHFVSLTGIPSLFGLAPELLLKQAK